MGQEIYDEAYRHFELEGRRYEYGRSDKSLKNHSPNGHIDPSRTEQDLDHDGFRGVDCSSLVWRGLKNAGYDVGESPFTTSALFKGHSLTPYAKEHFQTIGGTEAARTHGTLKPGDILMFEDKKGPGQHVGIFKGYDAKGQIEFFGSQVSTGPATVTSHTAPGEYWNGGRFEIVGALRPKPEFQIHPPLHAPLQGEQPAALTSDTPQPTSPEVAPTPPTTTAQPDSFTIHTHRDPLLEQGAGGRAVTSLQADLAELGYKDGHGQPLEADGHFGIDTRHAVERFQHDHGLTVDGVAGTKTLDAIHHAQAKHVAPGLGDPKNPDHTLYEQARAAVHRLDASMGRTSDRQSDQLAASLVVAAKHQGMTAIDTVVLSEDGSHAFAVQGRPDSPLRQMAFVPTGEAVNTPIDKSSAAAQLINQQQAPQQPTQPPAPAQTQSAPAMAR